MIRPHHVSSFIVTAVLLSLFISHDASAWSPQFVPAYPLYCAGPLIAAPASGGGTRTPFKWAPVGAGASKPADCLARWPLGTLQRRPARTRDSIRGSSLPSPLRRMTGSTQSRGALEDGKKSTLAMGSRRQSCHRPQECEFVAARCWQAPNNPTLPVLTTGETRAI
jgi:hypothetical protein